MDPTAVLRMMATAQFQRGLMAGMVALVGGVLARKLRPDWGLVWLGAAIVAGLWADVIGLAATERAFLLRGWVPPAAVLAVVLGSYGVYANRERPEIVPAFAVSLGGIWATVPDTESPIVLLGVTAGLIWLWWPRSVLPLRLAGSLALVFAATWAGGVGAIGREGAYVGAFGAVASLALLSRPHRLPSSWWELALHAVAVLGWTRWAGLSRSPTTALLIGGIVTIGVWSARWAVASKRRRSAGG